MQPVFRLCEADREKLGRAFKDICRHKARDLGIPICKDGWVEVATVLEHPTWHLLDAGGAPFNAIAVREMAETNSKKRFEINGGGVDGSPLRIRAVQGHSMTGIAEDIGVRLVARTAPQIAVHGTFLRHMEQIRARGLERGRRNHIHLAKGLLGEDGVFSGMRANSEAYIFVDVRSAIQAGYVFYEAANGVILCDGRGGDGTLPPAFFSIVIELHGSLTLLGPQVRDPGCLVLGRERLCSVEPAITFSARLGPVYVHFERASAPVRMRALGSLVRRCVYSSASSPAARACLSPRCRAASRALLCCALIATTTRASAKSRR